MTTGWGGQRSTRGWRFLSPGTCAYFSILIHEFGHVFMGRLLGADGHVVLVVSADLLLAAWLRELVEACFWSASHGRWPDSCFGAAYCRAFPATCAFQPLAAAVVEDLLFINLWWG